MSTPRSKTPKKRTLRDAQTDLTRKLLLDSAWELAQTGAEPTMRAVAARAGVAERTVYRYFENLEALVTALHPYFIGRAGIPLCERADQLEDYAVELYATFDANVPLVTMLLTSAWWLRFARGSRAKNLADMRRLLDTAYPKASAADRAAAAATLRAVLSGSGWLYLRESCGLSRDALASSARWMVRTHLRALEATP
jgi:AcrR family transcriptional regulator